MASSEVEAVLDTSFVVRYLTDDPPDLAARAATVIDGERVLGLSTVVLAEAWYVLQQRYHVPREAVLDALLGVRTFECFTSRRNSSGRRWSRAGRPSASRSPTP